MRCLLSQPRTRLTSPKSLVLYVQPSSSFALSASCLENGFLSCHWCMCFGQRDVSFNLYVAPFPNVYVPNFKLEDSCQRFLVFRGLVVGGSEGQRFGGSEVLSSR